MATDIGIESGVLADGYDLSSVLTGVQVADPMDALDSTKLRNPSRTRQFTAGLAGGAVQTTALPDISESLVNTRLRRGLGAARSSGQELMICGANVGDFALFFKSLQTTWRIDPVAAGLISSAADFQVTSGVSGKAYGVLLQTPFGSANINISKLVRLSGANASGSAVIALPSTPLGAGGNVTVTQGMTTSALQTAIRTLAGYNDAGVIVGNTGVVGGGGLNEVQTISSAVAVVLTAQGTGTSQTLNPGDSLATLGTKLAAAKGITNGDIVATGTSSAASSAAAFDAITEGGVPSGASFIPASHTVGASANRYLLVKVSVANETDTISGITYNGVAMTQLKRQVSVGGGCAVEVWGLVAPASGANNVAITKSGTWSASGRFQFISYSGIDQTTPLDVAAVGASSTTGSPTASISPINAAVVVDFFDSKTNATAPTVGAGQTTRGTIANTGTEYQGGSEKVVSSGATSMSWTTSSAAWATAVIALRSASATPGSLAITATFSGASVTKIAQTLFATATGGVTIARTQTGTPDIYNGAYDLTFGGALNGVNISPISLTSGTGYSIQTIQDGGAGQNYNLVSASVAGAMVTDIAFNQTSNNGALIEVQTVQAGTSANYTIQHSVDNGSGQATTWVDLVIIPTINAVGAVRASVAAGVTIQSHVRVNITAISGTVIAAIGFARR